VSGARQLKRNSLQDVTVLKFGMTSSISLACSTSKRERGRQPGNSPRAEFEAWNAAGQGQGIDRQLGDWLIGWCIGLVVEGVHRAVSDLQKVDVAGDRSFSGTAVRRKFDPCSDVLLGEPDQISIATVTLSLASMNFCRVS